MDLAQIFQRSSAAALLFALSLLPTAASAATTGRDDHPVGSQFSDCRGCPVMIVLPAGRIVFPDRAGAEDVTERSQPVEVTFRQPFAMGVFDVTRAQFAEFVKATGGSSEKGCEAIIDGNRWSVDKSADWRHPGFPQTDRDPVVCVSWVDAQAYIGWLNAKLRTDGKDAPGSYRLPSGSEWEYAALGGSLENPVAVHHEIRDYANLGLDNCFPCGGERAGRDHWLYTSPVGSLAPNRFGLYDIVGNVWQWTDDCYKEVPVTLADGSPAPGDCALHLLWGPSWNDRGSKLAWADLVDGGNAFPKEIRNYANGFRVVRDLTPK